MRTLKNNYDKIDFIFWFAIILFTNPGGILKALGEDSGDGGVNITDLLFVVISFCFIFIFDKKDKIKDRSILKIIKFLFIFSLYYLIVFSFFVPIFKNNQGYSVLVAFIKSRYAVMNVLLVFPVYFFYNRSYKVFYKTLLYTSIIVIFIFLISVFTGVDYLPIERWDRHFVDIKRIILTNYGLMPLLIPMGVVVIIFRFEIKIKRIILFSFILMFITWLLSLYRRHIFGTFIYFFMASMLDNYIKKKSLIPVKNIMRVIVYVIVMGFVVQLIFPKQVEAAVIAAQETVYIIQYGETTKGRKDTRLGMGKNFMQEIVKDNPVFGTGFDNRWRTGSGDKLGFEATDYPFIGALAMTGIVGLLFFLPIYIVLINALIFDIKFLRNYQFDTSSFQSYIILLFVLYFVYDMMQYMNWFWPISVMEDPKWYVFLAMYFASRNIFYNDKNKWKKIISKN